MKNLNDIFLNSNEFLEVEKEWQFLDCVYVSRKSIFALKYFETIEQLMDGWESCQTEFASRVQGRLKNKFDGYRWDMYLLIYVNEELSPIDRKYIENDRLYFRKILISKSELIEERLPFTLTYNDSFESFLFGHDHFLKKLEEQLSEEVSERFDKEFFKKASQMTEDEIFNLVVRKLGE